MPIALSPMQLWDSDYRLVHLLLTYKQKLKCAKSVVKTVRRWTKRGKAGITGLL